MSRWYVTILLAANLTLLLPDAFPLRVLGGLLIIGFLPGLGWVNRLRLGSEPWLRWTLAAAGSYALTQLTILLLFYLPGPLQLWQLLVILNSLAILPIVIPGRQKELEPEQTPETRSPTTSLPGSPAQLRPAPAALLLVLLVALLLRTINLHYSEFQGDEALAMITAAEALEGHADALFLRSKGPGEVLMPMALWRLTGTINETMARLPFSIAALFAVVTIYLIAVSLGDRRTGWLAALFFAVNGFMVAFGRIVQYQALVIWMSALAFLMAIRWHRTGQARWLGLGGFFLGIGLLAHYDAILVLPAIGWLLFSGSMRAFKQNRTHLSDVALSSLWPGLISLLRAAALLLIPLLLATLPFYLPFVLDPQANRTGDYLGGRIGTELRNNLPDFFHFNIFYSSAYYLILTGVLVLGLLAWFIWQSHWTGAGLSILVTGGILAVTFFPNLLAGDRYDLSILPFLLLLLGAFFVPVRRTQPFRADQQQTARAYRQALIAWLAVPFLGYNFVVALGLTHIYTIVPAWSLLAGLAWPHFFGRLDQSEPRRRSAWISATLLTGWALLSIIFLWNAFIRHDVEYWQDYPAATLWFYWTPYDAPPAAGLFGLVHRSGWKAVGQHIVANDLRGDYGSNEEPDVTTWYTRGTPRACDPQPEFYFLAPDLVDPIAVPSDIIENSYTQIGAVTLPNQKQMRIMQQKPKTLTLGALKEISLARDFDRTATPAAFARSARGSLPAAANFGNRVQLIGYDLDTRRAYPGGRVPVTLYWQAITTLPASYQVFTHLESASGPVAQADGIPVCWSYPTDRWRPGQIIADQHAIPISLDTPSGQYPLEVGFYLPDTFERLDILDEAGNPAGTSLPLTTVEIRN